MVRHTGEDFINVEAVAVSAMFPLQPPGIYGSKLDAPEADRLPSDDDASFCEEILDIAVAQVK